MQYASLYQSPLGAILLTADDDGLTGLWFDGEKDYESYVKNDYVALCTPFISAAKNWLDVYFSGKEPDFIPMLHISGTDFQRRVWRLLLDIPYGQTVSYGQIARQVVQPGSNSCPQATGGAVGRNKISIIIPCHRVVGANGNLTGYGGGLDRKVALLKLEKTDMSGLFMPKKRKFNKELK